MISFILRMMFPPFIRFISVDPIPSFNFTARSLSNIGKGATDVAKQGAIDKISFMAPKQADVFSGGREDFAQAAGVYSNPSQIKKGIK
jgi:hypothetical protein